MSANAGPVGTGRRAVVTGATSGIGHEVARRLAADGFEVVVVGRGSARVAAAAAEISRATGNPHVDAVEVNDLAAVGEVRGLAATLLVRYPKIHVLVNNAGAYFRRRELTPDGLERTFALNVLAPFLLTSLLAERLKASAPARVVNVASAAHRRQRVRFDDLQSAEHFSGFSVYGRSKLELILLTREFARRFAGTGVTVNAVHPGFVHSGFALNNGGATRTVFQFLGAIFGKSVARGADTPVFVAENPSLGTVTGEYFSGRRAHAGDPASRDLSAAARLFDAVAAIAAPLPKPA